MSATRHYTLKCDLCFKQFRLADRTVLRVDSADEIREYAARNGWRFNAPHGKQKKDKCPVCRKKK